MRPRGEILIPRLGRRDKLGTCLGKRRGQALFGALLVLALSAIGQEKNAAPTPDSGISSPGVALPWLDSSGRHAVGGDSAGPAALEPEEGVHSFHLRMDQRNLIRSVLGAYRIQAAIDQSVNAKEVTFDVTEASFSEALDLVKLATNTLITPLDSHYVLVLADSKESRGRLERATQTIPLPGLSPTELSDVENVARNVLGLQYVVMNPRQSSLTVRGTEAELAALKEALGELLAHRSEVNLDVHIYEVDQSKETDAGVILPNSATLFNLRSAADSLIANNASLVQQIISEGLASPGNWQEILAALIASGALSGTIFNNPFVVFGGGLTETGMEWNTSAFNMLLNSSYVRSLNEVQLRALDQEEATFRSGERYPIMASSFSIVSGSQGTSSGTTPQIQYADLGLTLKIKPYIQNDTGVYLHLDLKLDSLSGSTLDNIPILTSREYAGVISVHPGRTALLVSAMSTQDSEELTGIPGLSEIREFKDLTNRQSSTDHMEVAITITPHLVRLAHRESFGPMLLLPYH
jgi:general secretion pathway protein D